MLTFSLEEGCVIRVVETLMSYTTTQSRYWYYDLEKKLVSSHGKEGDVPDRPLTAEGLDWARRYYLPKICSQLTPEQHRRMAGL